MSKSDRRVRRTQEALQRALVELIQEQGFEATTISEIAQRADVGRSTFYAHYADKEDLLIGSAEILRGFLKEQIDIARNERRDYVHPALSFCRPMLEHAHEARGLFLAMVGRRSGYLFQELAHDMWADFVRQGWNDADEVAVQTIAGGFGATIAWWLQTMPKLTPGEVENRFCEFIQPALEHKP